MKVFDRDCGPLKSKKYPTAYNKEELIELAKNLLKVSTYKAKKMKKNQICESIYNLQERKSERKSERKYSFIFEPSYCGPLKSKKNPNAYNKNELVNLASKFLNLNISSANKLTKEKLCEKLKNKKVEMERLESKNSLDRKNRSEQKQDSQQRVILQKALERKQQLALERKQQLEDLYLSLPKLEKKSFSKQRELQRESKTKIENHFKKKMNTLYFYNKLNEKYDLMKILGEGTYGFVLRVLDRKDNLQKVIKVQIIDTSLKIALSELRRELLMHKKFEKLGMAPRLFGSYIYSNENNSKYVSVIEMEEIDDNLDELLSKKRSDNQLDVILSQLYNILKVKKSQKIVHGDLHFGNIGFKKDKNGKIKLYLIDFGFACCLNSDITYDAPEVVQIFKSLYKIDPYNEKYLVKNIIKWDDVFYTTLDRFLMINGIYPYDKNLYKLQILDNRDIIDNLFKMMEDDDKKFINSYELQRIIKEINSRKMIDFLKEI